MTVKALRLVTAVLLIAMVAGPAFGGAFVFAGAASGTDVVTHPTGYDGTGGTLSVSVCIDPTSANAMEMAPAVQRAIATWNARVSTTGNLVSGGANDIPAGKVDFESVFVHELGHCIGLAHSNVGNESGLPAAQQDYTQSTPGADASFDTVAGGDGIQGSFDDQRDDDVNLHWFEIGVNDPFGGTATTFDSTTFSRSLADLPPTHDYVANGTRSVGAATGAANSEAVMKQLTFFDEAQRSLVRDDVATLRYAMSGLDELEGTSDDYLLSLSYAGMTNACDIVVDFDDTQTGFAVCFTGGSFIPDPPPGPPRSTDHIQITSAEIFFNNGFSWFFDPACGDGVVAGAETCDDGGTTAGDGCDPSCAVEPGYLCSGEPSLCSADCGDGVVAGAETCDDGGTTAGDGCDPSCAVEPGYLCSGEPSLCSADCGDGVVAGAETCDDGGAAAGDGCDPSCAIEPGYLCSGEPSLCSADCGDGVVAGAETCDDGGTAAGDGCDPSCTVEPGYLCSGEPSLCSADCGDGVVAGAETCDDGGTTAGDGCDPSCTIEPGYLCSGEPSLCSTDCGDGVITGAETCDDGAAAAGDGCDPSCAVEPGYLCSGEPSLCSTDCGDGVVAGAETCDDGGTTAGDGCDPSCIIEPGYLCSGEPSLCSTDCGDGVIAGAETCDDGAAAAGDGCDPSCAIEPGYLCSGEPSDCSPLPAVPMLGYAERCILSLMVLASVFAALMRRTQSRYSSS